MYQRPFNENIINEFKNIVGSHNVVLDSKSLKEFLLERRGNFISKGEIALLPESTLQVSKVLRFCYENGIKVVVQGGNSSLVGSTVSNKNEVILSLKNMTTIESISNKDLTIVASSGVLLKTLQEKCQKQGLFFPFDIPSREICTLAGLASTNAGGITALRYGVFKDLVQGLEVVLADGDIINDLHTNKKRNIGLNLSSLFLGTEGINGVITKLSLKCIPLHKKEISLVFASDNASDILEFYSFIHDSFFDFLESFELMNKEAFKTGKKASSLNKKVFTNDFETKDFIALIKLTTRNKHINLKEICNKSLKQSDYSAKYLILEPMQEQNAWKVRSSIHAGQKEFFTHSFKHDIAVPLSKIAAIIKQGTFICKNIDESLKPLLFGHVGDGNLHFNICTNKVLQDDEKQEIRTKLREEIFKASLNLGGTFSAEHGIGLLNKDYLAKYHKDHNNIMIKIKSILDDKNILNNGKTVK